MSEREKWIEAGSRAISAADPATLWGDWRGEVELALHAIEPLIRADERERIAQALEAIPANYQNLMFQSAAARIARNGGSDE